MPKPALPLHLNDLEAEELIWPPPDTIRTAADLRPYQQWMSDQIVAKRGVLLGAEPGLGKAQPLRAKVQTPHGERTIGDLRIGDGVFGRDGQVYSVTGVFPQGEQDTYRVTFRDGASAECNLEHLWTVRTTDDRTKGRAWKVKTLGELVQRGISRGTSTGAHNRWEIPMCEPLEFPERQYAVEPYVMGVFLGDGCGMKSPATISISGADQHIFGRVKAGWPDVSHRLKTDGVLDIGLLGTATAFRGFGLLGVGSARKFIPEEYQHGSIQQRKALLTGLMDTDGSCSKQSSTVFHTTSEQLAADLCRLVCGLGGTARVRRYDRAHDGKPTDLQVNVRTTFNPFSLPRKAERWREPVGQTRVQRRITGVEFVRREPQVCIAVDAPDHLYLTDHCIVTHNTGTVLHAFARLRKRGVVRHGLIVAPLFVAENTWPQEIAAWTFSRPFSYAVVTGTEAERRAALALGRRDLTIINRENLAWLFGALGTARWHFDFMAYDESSRLKRGMKWTRPVQRKDGSMSKPKLTDMGIIDRVRSRTRRTVLLSGTPASNGLLDLYGQIHAIDGGRRLGTSMTAYRNRWFRLDRSGYRWEPFPHSHEQIMSAISDVFASLRTEDYLALPPLVEIDHEAVLSRSEKAVYDEMEEEALIEVMHEGRLDTIEAVNDAVLVGKLLQLANGGAYRADGTTYPFHTRKLDILESIVEESGGAPLLVAYSFLFDKDALLKRFPKARVFGEDPNDVRNWNAGKYPMMILHPASAAHGLNLQHGSNRMVWYGLPWSLELYQQFIKRLWRSGQKRDKVFMHRIITRGTADRAVLQALLRKGATQDSIMEAVRVRSCQR